MNSKEVQDKSYYEADFNDISLQVLGGDYIDLDDETKMIVNSELVVLTHKSEKEGQKARLFGKMVAVEKYSDGSAILCSAVVKAILKDSRVPEWLKEILS